jgi:hypothetical protein
MYVSIANMHVVLVRGRLISSNQIFHFCSGTPGLPGTKGEVGPQGVNGINGNKGDKGNASYFIDTYSRQIAKCIVLQGKEATQEMRALQVQRVRKEATAPGAMLDLKVTKASASYLYIFACCFQI